jgi:hypothetical protein
MCKPYRPRHKKVKSWVIKKTDESGPAPARPGDLAAPIPAHLQRPRLQTEYVQREWPRPELQISAVPTIPDRPLRGWLGGLGAIDWKLLRSPKPNLLGNPIATEYYRWFQRLRPFVKAAIVPISPFAKWQGKDSKRMCWCSYKAMRAQLTFYWNTPIGWLVIPREHRQAQPTRKSLQEIFDIFQFEPAKIVYSNGWTGEVYPLSRARLRLMERGFSSFSKGAFESLINPDLGLPYEPFELAYPFCERNPASRWPRVWTGLVMPRHTVYNSAIGLEFTDRTLADARRSYLISQPELAEVWGCSPRTVWSRLQGMTCACRVCIAARQPEFKRLLYRVILPTIRPYWEGEIGSQADKAQQRRDDNKRKFEGFTSEPTWGWDRKPEE